MQRLIDSVTRQFARYSHPVEGPHIYDLTNSYWGHSCERLSGTMDVNEVSGIAGHLTPRPRENDLMKVEMGSRRMGLYRFFDIEYTQGVPDMFFASVDWHGYEDEG